MAMLSTLYRKKMVGEMRKKRNRETHGECINDHQGLICGSLSYLMRLDD